MPCSDQEKVERNESTKQLHQELKTSCISVFRNQTSVREGYETKKSKPAASYEPYTRLKPVRVPNPAAIK